ncbi:hypothetical protein GJ496_004749 [Pomphorhynchus laevis]|nr:hypothetical protein GJ496_004749 [Pomphorhynchus laevis]
MNESEVKFDNFFSNTFDKLNTNERWKLQSEGQMADAVYMNKQNQAVRNSQIHPKEFDNTIKGSLRQSNTIDDDINDAKHHKNSVKPAADNEKIHRQYIVFQKSVKDLNEKFNKQEDFIRHIDFGTEFDEVSKYNSKRKTSDALGFEYCVPPKEQTIQAKLLGRYNYWVEKEKQLEEDEEMTMHEMTGSEIPFKITDLTYDVPYANSESYENYYWKIKDLRGAEQKYQHQVNNIADSALIIDGNVAFGKTVNTENVDDNPAFERKLSTNSLGDFGTDVDFDRQNTRKKLTSLVKKIRRRRSSDSYDDSNIQQQAKLLRSESNSYVNNSVSKQLKTRSEQFATIRRKLHEGTRTLARRR